MSWIHLERDAQQSRSYLLSSSTSNLILCHVQLFISFKLFYLLLWICHFTKLKIIFQQLDSLCFSVFVTQLYIISFTMKCARKYQWYPHWTKHIYIEHNVSQISMDVIHNNPAEWNNLFCQWNTPRLCPSSPFLAAESLIQAFITSRFD